MNRSLSVRVRRVVTRPVTGLALVFIVLATDARAQAPAVDVRASYAFLRDSGINFAVGWSADAAVHLDRHTSVVVEMGRSRETAAPVGLPTTFTVSAWQGGMRVEAGRRLLRPYGQLLGGVTRVAASASLRGKSASVSSVAFSLQPGGGVIVQVTPRVGVTAAADYRWGSNVMGSLNEFRVSGGVALALTRR
jgi:hypothetical protein